MKVPFANSLNNMSMGWMTRGHRSDPQSWATSWFSGTAWYNPSLIQTKYASWTSVMDQHNPAILKTDNKSLKESLQIMVNVIWRKTRTNPIQDRQLAYILKFCHNVYMITSDYFENLEHLFCQLRSRLNNLTSQMFRQPQNGEDRNYRKANAIH